MRLEEGLAREKLDENAADRKHVARVRPAEAKDDFWRAVVPGRYDGRMVLALKGRRAKVDKPDVGVVEQELLFVWRSLGGVAASELSALGQSGWYPEDEDALVTALNGRTSQRAECFQA